LLLSGIVEYFVTSRPSTFAFVDVQRPFGLEHGISSESSGCFPLDSLIESIGIYFWRLKQKAGWNSDLMVQKQQHRRIKLWETVAVYDVMK
jgi:hypothetical protein